MTKLDNTKIEVKLYRYVLTIRLIGGGGLSLDTYNRGLRTPNECINQTSLKNWADVAEKICHT